MVEYKIFTQEVYNSACGFYTTYGIIAFDDGKRSITIGDITLNRESIEKMVYKFNENRLELCHLREAIEDFLYDLCID